MSLEKLEPGLFRNPKTGKIYVRETFRREKIPDLFKSTGEIQILRARSKKKELIAEHRQHYLGGEAFSNNRKGQQLAGIIDEFLRVETPYRRESTQYNHRYYLNELKQEWGAWEVGRITEVVWRDWLIKFKQRKNRESFWDYTVYMNMILRYAYKHRYAKHLLTLKNMDSIRTDVGRVFTQEEIKGLWNVMNETTRDQFALSYECFMRLREVLYLEWSRVDFAQQTITLNKEDVKTGSRTGKGRVFKFSDHVKVRLEKRFKASRGARYVFPSPTARGQPAHDNKAAWGRAKREAKIIGRARWHDLRHTAISRALLEKGMNPILVSEYAGVSMRTIQKVYLHSRHEHTASIANAVRIDNLV